MQPTQTNDEIKITPAFPQSFQILPEWIEKTNDLFLLNLATPLVVKIPLMKSLLTTKIEFISNPQKHKEFEVMSNTEKETGNSFMKTGNFAEAITHYTYSLIYNPKESATYSNRSLAYIKQSQFQKGIYDCTNAIEINRNYTKAFYRRATCFSNLKKYRMALDDLLYLLNTGNNSQEIEVTIKDIITKFKKDIGNENWNKMAKDIQTQIDLAKQQKADIPEPWEISNELKNKFNVWETTSQKVKSDLKELLQNQKFIKANEIVKSCYEQCMKFKDEYNDKTQYHLQILQAMSELNSMKIIIDHCIEQETIAKKELEKKKKKANVHHDKFYKTTLLSKEQRDKATKIAEQDIKFDDFANSAYGFERAFNSFKTRDDLFFEFLKFFQGKTIQKVYANSEIPFPVLNGVIQIFIKKEELISTDEEIKNLVLEYLESIKTTKGFGLVKNFIKKADKVSLKRILENIKEKSDKQETKDLSDELIKQFC